MADVVHKASSLLFGKYLIPCRQRNPFFLISFLVDIDCISGPAGRAVNGTRDLVAVDPPELSIHSESLRFSASACTLNLFF